ncbi:aldehyde dehydrogenase family protein [Streptomyces sp. NPDC001795]|uniref:aldehyde dehydrogenase family protein n=1 Tax=Streptomyces sp. NPDC001795 TaxID=3154525 RepID=UPI00332428CE
MRTTWDARVTTGMDAYKEELFGPVLAVLRVDTLDRAIDLINANPYGNGTALFTASIGDSSIHGPEGIRFYTRPKVVTTRRPQPAQQVAAGFNFPTSS